MPGSKDLAREGGLSYPNLGQGKSAIHQRDGLGRGEGGQDAGELGNPQVQVSSCVKQVALDSKPGMPPGPVGPQGSKLPMPMTPHHQPYPQAPTHPSGNISVSSQKVSTSSFLLLCIFSER